MRTVKLDEIICQRDPELKQVVEQLARGEVAGAVQNLERQARSVTCRARWSGSQLPRVLPPPCMSMPLLSAEPEKLAEKRQSVSAKPL